MEAKAIKEKTDQEANSKATVVETKWRDARIMTINSRPWVKLLVTVIAAIVIGSILDSWGWGIAVFIIAMFLFIFVADWIFGRPSKGKGGNIKGKVEVIDELEKLLNELSRIGNIKNHLPFNQRDWCSSLGLF